MLRGVFILTQSIGAVLLILALADNPSGYYQLVRLVMLPVCLFAVYCANKWRERLGSKKWRGYYWILAFAWVAILFNPIYQIGLPNPVWKTIDACIAALMLVSIFSLKPKRSQHRGSSHA